MSRRVWRWGLAALAGLLLAGLPQLVSAAGPPVTTAGPSYYLALGDSLATGYQPQAKAAGALTTCGYQYGYACDLYKALHKSHSNLQAVNLSCPGETTTSMLTGVGSPCFSAGPPQLARALQFLARHRGQVALITIDIGANNVDGCVSSGSVSATCLSQGMQAVATQLPAILSALRGAAGAAVPIVGMNYYDPFLAAYLLGSTGVSLASESLPVTVDFNQLLDGIYALAGDPVANVQTAFYTLVTSVYGSTEIPTNVAIICLWTWMCTSAPNIHANTAGYVAIAGAFEQLPAVANLVS